MDRMSRERWLEIDRIFSDALDLSESHRGSFLDDACRGREDLRPDVEELLKAAAVSSGFLSGPPPGLADLAAGDPLPPDLEPAPSRLGDYRVDRVLGRGGMGTVYLGFRADGAFEQRVALKLLRRGLDTDDIVARFRTERQILAGLDHPNIARLIDGGASEDGRPWLAMECVDGVPITEYCDRNQLPLAGRLRLMAQVTAAVEHAHRHLVVHRDLKPGNILVTADGDVKLVDFGIAKLLRPDDNSPLPKTRTGFLLLTPQYASPEQLKGEPITTATDVYQLGVVLYELLTGSNPHSARRGLDGGADDVARPSSVVLRQNADVMASAAQARRTTPVSLKRELRGDLDAIVLTALASDVDRRYATARELGNDLRRYLSGDAVAARPDTLSYRLRTFARRHRVAMTAASLLFVLTLSWIVTITVQRAELVRQRDRARAEAMRAQQTAEFLRGLFSASDPNQTLGETITARELLDAGARNLRSELRDEPELRASLLRTIADVYEDLGVRDGAAGALEEVIATKRQLDLDVSDDLRSLARVIERSDPGRSDQLYTEALAEAKRRHGPQDVRLAGILTDYGAALGYRGGSGKELTAEALRILRASDEGESELFAHALLVHAYGEPLETAIPAMEEALAIRRRLHGDEHLSVATALNDLALALEPADVERSTQLLEEAVRIHDKLAGPEHPLSLRLTNSLAAVYRDAGRHAEAERHYRRVLELRREFHSDERLPLSYTLYGLAVVLHNQQKLDEPEGLLVEALALQSQAGLPDTDIRVLSTRTALAEVLLSLRRTDEARAALQLAAQGLGELAEDHPLRARISDGLEQTAEELADG